MTDRKMVEYDFYFDQYRRVPRNSATTNRDLLEFQSQTTLSTLNTWSRYVRRPLSTTYIDGSTLMGLEARPSNIKDSFPKSKSIRKASASNEKRQNTGDAYMSLVPCDKTLLNSSTIRSEKSHSPLSMATATQSFQGRDFQRRSASSHRSQRLDSAIVYQDESNRSKIYGSSATSHANGAWVRRYKSMTESHNLTDMLRDSTAQDQIFLRKRSHPQLYLLSSTTSIASSLNKRRREKAS